MTLVIDVPKALREPEYMAEISRELEGDMSADIMEHAADEIERLTNALVEIRSTVTRSLDPRIWHMANRAIEGKA